MESMEKMETNPDAKEWQDLAENSNFDQKQNEYNVAIKEAELMVDKQLCPDAMWRPLKSELVRLSNEMADWREKHENVDPDMISAEDAAEWRRLADDRADIAVRILPKEASFEDVNNFYSVIEKAAQAQREIESNK